MQRPFAHVVRPAAYAPLCASLWAMLACSSPDFRVHGAVAADERGHTPWKLTPEGCTRDPFDGRPPAETQSILTFIWEDYNARAGQAPHDPLPDGPLRLEFSHRGGGAVVAVLHTVKEPGIALDEHVCSQLELTTRESPAALRGGRATLAGGLALECQTAEVRVSAHLQFEHCGY